MLSPACEYGWRRQDPKQVIVFCPDHATFRGRLYEEAGKRRMGEDLLHQFSFAKGHTEWAEEERHEGEETEEAEEEEHTD